MVAYHIYMATVIGEWTEIVKTEGTVYTFTVKNLVQGQTYFFAVAARYEVGLGPMVELKHPVKTEIKEGKIHLYCMCYNSSHAYRTC